MTPPRTDAGTTFTYKQSLQHEIIDIDEDLDRLTKVHPQLELVVAHIRDMLGRCIHPMTSVGTAEFCSPFGEGGLE